MSAKQVLIFILGIIFALGVLWLVFPADGIAAGPVTVRYASYRRSLADAKLAKVNVDSVLRGVDARFRMEDDTLHYYRTFFYENPDRIYLPEDDFRFFDPLFRQLEQAREHEKTVRILHDRTRIPVHEYRLQGVGLLAVGYLYLATQHVDELLALVS